MQATMLFSRPVFLIISLSCLPTLVRCWVAQVHHQQGNDCWSARRLTPQRTDALRTRNDKKFIHRKNGRLVAVVLRQSSSQEEVASSEKEQDSNERRLKPGAASGATTPHLTPVPEAQHLHTMTVKDATDLTTLVGQDGIYEDMVTVLFKTEDGNVRWRSVKGQTKDSFLKTYSKDDPMVELILQSWIKDVGLEGKFEGQQTSAAHAQHEVIRKRNDEESALAGGGGPQRYITREYMQGVDPACPSTLPRTGLVELILKLASDRALVVLMGPPGCGKCSLMNLVQHYCEVKETTPDGKPTPEAFSTHMKAYGSHLHVIMDGVAKLNLQKPWQQGDPHRILLVNSIHHASPEFWANLINEGFAWKEGVRIVGALSDPHVPNPRFSPVLQEDSTISFSKLRLTQDEEDRFVPTIMNDKTNLNRLDEASRTAIVNAVLDQCQGHMLAITVSLEELDGFAQLPQNQNYRSIISYLLSKQFLDDAFASLWVENMNDFSEGAKKELQDAMIDDKKVIGVAVQSLLNKAHFVPPETDPKARTWPQIKQEITFKLAARRLYSSLFPPRGPEGRPPLSVEDLVERALKTFYRDDLIQSCEASDGNFPKEEALQQMFYFGLVASLPATTEVVAEISAILPRGDGVKKGELDFYVNKKFFYKCGIELMRKGNNFKEHNERFLPGGRFYTPRIDEYCIVDFQPFGFRTTDTDPSRLVIEFQSDYQGCNVWWRGKKLSALSFLLARWE